MNPINNLIRGNVPRNTMFGFPLSFSLYLDGTSGRRRSRHPWRVHSFVKKPKNLLTLSFILSTIFLSDFPCCMELFISHPLCVSWFIRPFVEFVNYLISITVLSHAWVFLNTCLRMIRQGNRFLAVPSTVSPSPSIYESSFLVS